MPRFDIVPGILLEIMISFTPSKYICIENKKKKKKNDEFRWSICHSVQFYSPGKQKLINIETLVNLSLLNRRHYRYFVNMSARLLPQKSKSYLIHENLGSNPIGKRNHLLTKILLFYLFVFKKSRVQTSSLHDPISIKIGLAIFLSIYNE